MLFIHPSVDVRTLEIATKPTLSSEYATPGRATSAAKNDARYAPFLRPLVTAQAAQICCPGRARDCAWLQTFNRARGARAMTRGDSCWSIARGFGGCSR